MRKGFLWVLYHVFKVLAHLYQLVYYPATRFRNKRNLRFKGPGIIVSNHPNALVDPIQVASRTPRQTFFLANSSLFKNPVAGFLLNHLYCIPIQRPGQGFLLCLEERNSLIQ
ncbi:MAG: 1-acyl-sn-glycerol-3-phosphate acyltransferase [Saprospiraceae bacterium]